MIAVGTPFQSRQNFVASRPEWAGNAFNPSLVELKGDPYLSLRRRGRLVVRLALAESKA